MIGPDIAFELSPAKLKQLKADTDCDYLINVKGNIINEGIGGLSIPSDEPDYYASNESSVSIVIYDLNSGILISSSQVYAKLTEEGSHFDNASKVPTLATSAQTAMLVGAKKLIAKYDKYRLDN